MSEDVNDIKLIEDYLEDKLDNQSKSEFDERLKTDQEFANLHAEISEMVDLIKEVSSKETLEYLKALDEKEFGKRKSSRKFLTVYFPTAAIITLVLVAGAFFFLSDQPNVSQGLFASSFIAPSNHVLPVVRSRDTPSDTKGKAYYAYEQGDYQQAISLFAKIPDTEDDGASLYYSGISLLAIDQPAESIVKLNQYIDQYNELQRDAEWFVFLAYVRLNHRENAIQQMNSLGDGHQDAVKMRDLLRKWEAN
ncbi:MAG: hypothetical protein AAFO69_09055 [Bacteroidota bacterium]